MDEKPSYTVFSGQRCLAAGPRDLVLGEARRHLVAGGDPVLFFEDHTGRQIEIDLDVTFEEPRATAGPGRPRLGVVSREISLLPRHWEWLETQPNGISAALRRLVDEARKHEPEKERARLAREAASRFMWGIAGDLPGFEEASRALFASEQARFERLVRGWPKDIRKHVVRLARLAVPAETGVEPAAAAVEKKPAPRAPKAAVAKPKRGKRG